MDEKDKTERIKERDINGIKIEKFDETSLVCLV